VVHPVATLKVAVVVAVVATATTPIDLNDNHQPSFEATAPNYKAASLIAATTNKLTPSSQL
jgi:hypothetical protein